MKELILSGTKEELQSSRAFKLVAAAAYAGLPLTTRVVTNDNDHAGGIKLPCNLPPPPGSSSSSSSSMSTLRLVYHQDTALVSTCTVAAGLKLLGRLAGPSSKLLGEYGSLVEDAQVDGWLQWTWSNMDMFVGVELIGRGSVLTEVLQQLDKHLLCRTYLVGNYITAADISVAASLQQLLEQQKQQQPAYENVQRWYQTVIHQDWWKVAAVATSEGAGLKKSSTTATVSSSSAAVSDAGVVGIQLNGPAPPVISEKYSRRSRLRIKELFGSDGGLVQIGEQVTVAGWARTISKTSAKLMFIKLNDGSTGESLQCVLDATHPELTGFDDCKGSGGTGASFQLTGTVIASPGSEQVIELQVTKAVLLGAVYGANVEGTQIGGMLYPLAKKEHSLEHFRDHAHLRARSNLHAAAMRIRHAMAYATHHFFHSHGFLYIHTPILTGADCEGAGEQFAVTTMLGNDHLKTDVKLPIVEKKEISKSELKRLEKQKVKADPTKPVVEHVPGAVDYGQDFFGQRVNLTVSGQLNVETHACALCDVYTFGPTFRAEESRTYRHLSEFWMIEPEIAFADLTDDINLAEDYLKYCVKFALENCAADLEFFEHNPHGEKGLRDRLRNVLDNEFKRLTYTEAIQILQKAVAEDGAVFETKPEWGIDLPSEHERYICEKVFNKPVVLTDYPKDIKAFYMKVNEDNKTVAACDILVPKIGEIIGGSQREHRYEVLKQRCLEMNLDPRSVWWYLDLRRYGTIPHAGFGLGFERLILFVTGLDNIRDVIPFPRWVGNAKF